MREGSLTMTVSLLRSIGCIVLDSKRRDKREDRRGEKNKTKTLPNSEDKLWKTFTEVAEEEQDFLKKYFASQERVKLSSVSVKEDVVKENSETKLKIRKECIIDIYDKALAKLPKLASYKAQHSKKISVETNHEDNDYIKLSSSICSEIPALLQVHKEIYYNSEFQDHLPSIHNRPLPPIPQ